jgi:hypothetical protein
MIYVASRASVPKYPQEWRRLRAQGWPINSSWIDESGEGETACMSELWTRIEAEVRAARGVVLWAEEEDFPLKGAFIEVGMALGMGKPVAVYTKTAFDNRNYRPFGSWMNHPLVQRCFSLESALTWVLKQPLGVMAWDASQIKQPGWNHVQQAFIDGAREARANPEATEDDFGRASDGYTKRVFEEVDPASEKALRTGSWKPADDSGVSTPDGGGHDGS